MQLKFNLLHTAQTQFVLYSSQASAASGSPHDAVTICLVILVCAYHYWSSYWSHCHSWWWHSMYPSSYISVRWNLRTLLWLMYRTVLWPQVTGSWFVKIECVYCIIVCIVYLCVFINYYYYNSPTQQYCYYDTNSQSYIPVTKYVPNEVVVLVYKIMLLCSQATSTAGSSTNASTTSGIDASESLKITCYLNDQYIALL